MTAAGVTGTAEWAAVDYARGEGATAAGAKAFVAIMEKKGKPVGGGPARGSGSPGAAEGGGGPGMMAVIRIRGTANVAPGIARGLESLRLLRPNNMALLPDSKWARRMCQKVKDYVTFGEADAETIAALLEKRGETVAGKKLAAGMPGAKKLDFTEAARSLEAGKATLGEMGVSNVFRLHPPRKGHRRKGVKAPYSVGGALGYRGKEINGLVMRMI